MTESQPTIIARRLLADHRFKALQEKARADKQHIETYVRKARLEFKLSNYWDEVLPIMLLNDGFKPEILAGGAIIETQSDPVTGQSIKKVVVSPEATAKDVASANRAIRKDQPLKAVRYSGRYRQEFRALELSQQDIDPDQIAETLNKEFGRNYTKEDVSHLVQKGKKKAKP